jgi:hypothetical protein
MILKRWLASRLLRISPLRPLIRSIQLSSSSLEIEVVFPGVAWLQLTGRRVHQLEEQLRRWADRPGFRNQDGEPPVQQRWEAPKNSTERQRLMLRWSAQTQEDRFYYAGLRIKRSPDCEMVLNEANSFSDDQSENDSASTSGEHRKFTISSLGRLEGFGSSGELLGWASRAHGTLLLHCKAVRIPIDADLNREDVNRSGLRQASGFCLEGSPLVALLKPFLAGHPIILLAGNQSLQALGTPLRLAMLPEDENCRLLEAWLGHLSLAELERAGWENHWLIETLRSNPNLQHSPPHQPDVWAVVFSRLQDAYGREATTPAKRLIHADGLRRVFAAASHINAIWRDAETVFCLAWIQELLRQRLLAEVLGGSPSTLTEHTIQAAEQALSRCWRPASTGFAAKAAHDFLNSSFEGVTQLALGAHHSSSQLTPAEQKLLQLTLSVAEVQLGLSPHLLERWRDATSPRPNQAITATTLRAFHEQGQDLRLQLALSQAPHHFMDQDLADRALASRLRLARDQGLDRDGLVSMALELWEQRQKDSLMVELPRELNVLIENLENDLFASPQGLERWPTSAEAMRQRRARRIEQIVQLKRLTAGPPPPKLRRHSGEQHRVLVMGNRDLPQVFRYRQNKLVSDLITIGGDQIAVESLDRWEDINAPTLPSKLLGLDLLVMCRLPATPTTLGFVLAARHQGIPVWMDIDDPIFDHTIFPPPHDTYAGTITTDQHASMLADTANFLGLLCLADGVITTTEPLRAGVLRCTELQPEHVRIHPNLMLPELLQEAKKNVPIRFNSRLRIVYGSGTKAHKREFFAVVLPALKRVLASHPRLEVEVIGSFTSSGTPSEQSIDRLIWSEPMGYGEYLRRLHAADISMAPLEINGATDAKSELKWFEGAMLDCAMVVSPTAAHRLLLTDEKDVLFATDEDDWARQLGRLVKDEELRIHLASEAKALALEHFHPKANQPRLKDLLNSLGLINDQQETN